MERSPLVSTTTGLLRNYSIPESVSGGLLVALLLTFLHVVGGPDFSFNLNSRDFLLVYFFTTAGLPQFIVALAINLLRVFGLMGRSYDAGVICAGFGGIALGSTPTAMANMTAVTQQ